MRRSLIVGLMLFAIPAKIASSWYIEAQASSGHDAIWRLNQDSRAGPYLTYHAENGHEQARLTCVGPSAAAPLMDHARGFNLALAFRTPAADAWVSGREAFVMLGLIDGWQKAGVFALHDSLVIDPLMSERAIDALRVRGQMKVKVVANFPDGIREQDMDFKATGLTDGMAAQAGGCTRYGIRSYAR